MIQLENQIINVISKELSIDKEEIHIGSDLYNELNCDDLDFVELMLALEEELEIEISDEEMEQIIDNQSCTVEELINLVKIYY